MLKLPMKNSTSYEEFILQLSCGGYETATTAVSYYNSCSTSCLLRKYCVGKGDAVINDKPQPQGKSDDTQS